MGLFLLLVFLVWIEGAILTAVKFIWPFTAEERKKAYENYLDTRWEYGCSRASYLIVALLVCCFWPVLVSFGKEQ